MADKSFGIKELNLIGSGTPKMESPNNINLNANNVAISTNATIGGNLDITGNLTVNGTSPTGGLTVQDEGSALSTTASTLNFVGTGVVASGTGATKTITINTSGDTNQNAFSNFVVSGQSTVSADSETDSVTFVAGSNMTITTNASGDSITFASSGGGGGGGVTVQDEGSALSTTATTLNFVGSGVVASGTGATKTITISAGSASTEVYIAESADTNAGYNIPFMNVTGGGGGSKGLQVDDGGFGFNPGTNTLIVNNVKSLPSASLSLGNLSSSSEDVTITGYGDTSRGLGYFKFTTLGSSVAQLLLGNVAIGYSSGSKSANPATSSSNMRNVFVGSLAGLNQQAGQLNTYIGFQAGSTNISGDQNVAIGYNAGDGNVSGSNNTYIGRNAAATSNGTNNEVVIGDTGVTKFRIPGIGVTFKDNGGRPGTGQVLTADANGEASFETINLSAQGITNTDTISNLSSSTDVMVGVAVGPRFHASYDANNQYILISSGDASGGRNYGTMKWRSGRESSGTSIYGNNNGASINIATYDGKMLLNNKSGNFGIGGSGHDGFLFYLDGTMVNASESGAGANMSLIRRSNGNAIEFKTIIGTIGSIALDIGAQTTTYNTTSDYRIKENVVGITSALDKINQLRPVNFNFIGKSVKLDGFLAHEVQAVVPYAVHGEKDAVKTVKDGDLSDGGTKADADRIAALPTKEIPDYQQLDYSKLVGLLTASIQELSAKNDALEARIKTLEG